MRLRYKILSTVFAVLLLAVTTLALLIGHTTACPSEPLSASEGEQMTAALSRCYGPPDTIEVVSLAKPVPTENEVLVKIVAASVNPLDWHYMRGSPYLMRLIAGLGTPVDIEMGADFAGTIESVGAKVTRYKPGDRVFGAGWGTFAQYITIDENRAVTYMPDNMSFEQAAAVPVAAITALQALRDKGQIQAGQQVLINGASGGVGTFAVQIAKSFGAEVTGVCSTRNLEMVRAIGADHVFDYTQEDYTESGQKFNLIIDNVGNHSLLANRRALKPGGRLVMVGGATAIGSNPSRVPSARCCYPHSWRRNSCQSWHKRLLMTWRCSLISW